MPFIPSCHINMSEPVFEPINSWLENASLPNRPRVVPLSLRPSRVMQKKTAEKLASWNPGGETCSYFSPPGVCTFFSHGFLVVLAPHTHGLHLKCLLVYNPIAFPLSSLLAPVFVFKATLINFNIHHCTVEKIFKMLFFLNPAKHLFIQDPHLLWICLYFCYLNTL